MNGGPSTAEGEEQRDTSAAPGLPQPPAGPVVEKVEEVPSVSEDSADSRLKKGRSKKRGNLEIFYATVDPRAGALTDYDKAMSEPLAVPDASDPATIAIPAHAPDLVSFGEWHQLFEAIKQDAVDNTIKKKIIGAEAYGEASSEMLSAILGKLELTNKDVFLDIGCGYGNVIFQAAAQYGCRAIGVEIRPDLIKLGEKMLPQVKDSVARLNKRMGDIQLIYGDALNEELMLEPMTSATVIFMNNFCYPVEMQDPLMHLFLQFLSNKTRIVALKALFPTPKMRVNPSRWVDLERVIVHPWKQYMLPPMGVSWSAQATKWHVYHVDREQELNTALAEKFARIVQDNLAKNKDAPWLSSSPPEKKQSKPRKAISPNALPPPAQVDEAKDPLDTEEPKPKPKAKQPKKPRVQKATEAAIPSEDSMDVEKKSDAPAAIGPQESKSTDPAIEEQPTASPLSTAKAKKPRKSPAKKTAKPTASPKASTSITSPVLPAISVGGCQTGDKAQPCPSHPTLDTLLALSPSAFKQYLSSTSSCIARWISKIKETEADWSRLVHFLATYFDGEIAQFCLTSPHSKILIEIWKDISEEKRLPLFRQLSRQFAALSPAEPDLLDAVFEDLHAEERNCVVQLFNADFGRFISNPSCDHLVIHLARLLKTSFFASLRGYLIDNLPRERFSTLMFSVLCYCPQKEAMELVKLMLGTPTNFNYTVANPNSEVCGGVMALFGAAGPQAWTMLLTKLRRQTLISTLRTVTGVTLLTWALRQSAGIKAIKTFVEVFLSIHDAWEDEFDLDSTHGLVQTALDVILIHDEFDALVQSPQVSEFLQKLSANEHIDRSLFEDRLSRIQAKAKAVGAQGAKAEGQNSGVETPKGQANGSRGRSPTRARGKRSASQSPEDSTSESKRTKTAETDKQG